MALSAAALVLVWPPWGFTWLAWVALVPFLIAIERAPSPWRAAVQGGWLSVGFGLGVLAPIVTAFGSYQDIGTTGGLFAAGLTAVVFQLTWPLFAALRQRGSRTGWLAVVGSGALYMALDGLVPKPFGDTLGLAFYEHAWLRQVADLGGPGVLTFVLVVVNEAVHRGLSAVRTGSGEPVGATVGVALTSVTLISGYGAARHAQWTAIEQRAPQRLTVAIVQGNVPLEIRTRAATGDDPASEAMLAAYLDASLQTIGEHPVDMLVWPETTYPGLFRQPFTESQARRNFAVDRFVQRQRTPLVLGTYLGETVDDTLVQYNGIVALVPTPESAGPVLPRALEYRKRELLPFGETVPWLGDGPQVRAWFPHVSFFGRGPGPTALSLPLPRRPVVVGPSVCYEDLFIGIPLAETDLGAEVLLNVSHDGWFGSWGPGGSTSLTPCSEASSHAGRRSARRRRGSPP